MKLSKTRILNYMLAKFNSEFIATNQPKDFILTEITPKEGYRYAFQAMTKIVSSKVVLRIYFNIRGHENMSDYVLKYIDDDDCVQTRAFVAEGSLKLSTIKATNDEEEFEQGDGVIDPTVAPFELLLSVCKEEW